jgi:hypothetical protein
VPAHARANLPEALADRLGPHRAALPELPFGSEVTAEELTLARALRRVQDLGSLRNWPAVDLARARAAVGAGVPDAARPYLARLGLDAPRTLRERAWQRAVTYGLSAVGALG